VKKILSVRMSCQVISLLDVCLLFSEILILAFSFYLNLGAGQRVSLYFVTNQTPRRRQRANITGKSDEAVHGCSLLACMTTTQVTLCCLGRHR